MAYHLTFNATTKLWVIDGSTGYIAYPSTSNNSDSGPHEVVVTHVPFDPVHKTGTTFWSLVDGPDAGKLVSSSTNSLGYGDITVTSDDVSDPGTPGGDIAHINALADWRVRILGMGGSGSAGTHSLTFNADTEVWSRTAAGIIKWPSTVTASAGGPYKVNPTTVPYDPVHQTGGSFWELKEGPNVGFLVSAHSNSLGYGDISVDGTGMNRGPGATLATLYHNQFKNVSGRDPEGNPHLAGASKLYNKAGEFHMTLLVDDPNVRVPVPKQTHYVIEFWDADTSAWVQPKSGFAGMIWDIDATETEVVFYGIDYLALLQFVVDERFDPSRPDRPTPNGSKYVSKTITQIVTEQLQHAVALLDSPVGFITVGSIATMPYRVTIYSTLQQCLPFVVGLLDSHRAGTSKLTELRVENTAPNTYRFVVEDDPGKQRPVLSLEYGTLAQGYQIREFGRDWASRVNMIGRDPTGRSTALQFQSVSAPQSQALWGRIAGAPQFVESIDKADMKRRALQAAIDASRVGRQVGIGTKLGSYRPFEAYNLLDMVPVIVNHGGVDTTSWPNDEFADSATSEDATGTGTGTWAIIGVQWETFDDGHWLTTPLLYPKGTGALKYGGAQGAFAYSDPGGVSTPVLPHNTTPGNILFAVMAGDCNVAITISGAGNIRMKDASNVDDTTDWEVLGFSKTNRLNMNIGGPSAGQDSWVIMRWRRILDTERTTTPLTVSKDISTGAGVWLYELPSEMLPTAVDVVASTHISGATQHFVAPTHTGNLLGGWVMVQQDVTDQPDALTPDTGVTTVTSAASNNNPILHDSHGMKTPWTFIGQMLAGGVFGFVFDPAADYTSINAAGVIVKFPTGMVLPTIPYSSNVWEGTITGSLEAGTGDPPPPPANGTGYGPPTIETQATSTYTDLLTGQQYTYNAVTESWDATSGTSQSDSGFYIFTFASATTWTITHQLGDYPSCHLFGTDGHEIEADIQRVSATQLLVTFTEAVAGTATLR